jgi:CheY-like chemotaxis protein
MTKKRILIIDDDVPLTQSMRINFEETGDYEVEIVNDSIQAMKRAREFRPDVILLDVVMPGYDGGDISAQLKDDAMLRDVPVLIITALVSNDETPEGSPVESGGQTMIAKPIKFEKLVQVIESKLGGN